MRVQEVGRHTELQLFCLTTNKKRVKEKRTRKRKRERRNTEQDRETEMKKERNIIGPQTAADYMRKPRSAAQAHRERFAWKFKRASRIRDLGSFLPFAVINWPASLVSPLHSTEFQLNRKPPPARYQI